MARSWNEMVHLQSHAVTDSNQRLYYKLPHQLEAHHKKTILWTSERATLASGSNFTACKALIAIFEAPDNYANVLPALRPPEALPDGELDLSIGGKGAEKRCAPSSKAYCERSLKCNGRGKQTLCGCGHPLLASGEKLRVTEPMIRAHFARIAAEQQGQS
ncbi:hypothetical protein C8R47DRAFT_1170187 [Mycena vitilis]|nr:hypothetical protein C8R47DRAFT_1170187 [Mycena vitilis]